MAVGTPTTNSGSSGAPNVAVPAGVAAGDIVVLVIEQDASTGTIGFPAGFTEFTEVNQTADGGRAAVAWKRLTGADSGTYTGSAGGALWAMTAIPLTGRHATDNPAISADSVQNTAQASGATITANGVTAVAGDDILFISCPDVTVAGGGNGHSSWSAGYTEIVDLEGPTGSEWCNIGVAKAENVSAGATGNKTATFATSSGQFGWAAWLVRVPSSGASTTPLTGSRRVVYNVTASLTGQRRVLYNVLAALAGQRRVVYNVLVALTGQRRVAYDVLAPVTGQRRVLYDVAGPLTGSRRIAYNVTVALTGQRRVAYSVVVALTGQRRVAYTVLAPVSGQRRVVYTVAQPVAGTRRVVYDVGDAAAGAASTLPILFAG